jgi:hypothetical protein
MFHPEWSGHTIDLRNGIDSPILHFVPLEVVAIVTVWFGLVMVAQAFQEVPKSHCIAVAFGLLPMRFSAAERRIESTSSRAEVWAGTGDLWADCA